MTQDPYGAVAPPLYQTATFDQVSAVQCGPYDYTRSGNPTRDQLEAQMADLEVLPSHALVCLQASLAWQMHASRLHRLRQGTNAPACTLRPCSQRLVATAGGEVLQRHAGETLHSFCTLQQGV